MKPTSIIFLVIAVLLIIGGTLLCSTAEDIALADNYTLFHDADDGGTYIREDFDASSISKIELLITDAEINIIGGAEEAYIEFINFRDGLYTLTNSGNVLSMDEIPDLNSIFNLQSGFSFSGMRYILRAGTASLGEKKVNIYLTQDAVMKILTVEADSCVINADKIYNQFDLHISADESVEINASDFRTACSLTVETGHLNASLYSSYLHSISLTAKTVEAEIEEIYWDNLTLDVDDGRMNILSTISLFRYAYDVKGKGVFHLNDQELPLPYTVESASAASGTVTADIGRAEITLTEIID